MNEQPAFLAGEPLKNDRDRGMDEKIQLKNQ